MDGPIKNFTKKILSKARRKILRQPYYCKALAGESNYNICINSDLTVSCNCGDYDGSGHIGDLSENSLEEIFAGSKAQQFRKKLAKGILPIDACKHCVELTPISYLSPKRNPDSWQMPTRGIMVENTVVCNYKCLACDRGVVDTRKRDNGRSDGKLMSKVDVEIVAKTIRDYGIQQVCYHNLGEPFLSRDILKEMTVLRGLNPGCKFVVSTNGTFVEGESKLKAALLFDNIFFSIDGSTQEALAKYQIGGDFHRSYRNMKSLIEYRDSRGLKRPVIEWKYVVFEWNDSESEISNAIDLARQARVDLISFAKGGMPGGAGESSRYVNSNFFKNLGEKSWQGRVVYFREDARDTYHPSSVDFVAT